MAQLPGFVRRLVNRGEARFYPRWFSYADDAGLGHAPDGNGQNTTTFWSGTGRSA
ncbi:MAG: hypothetical protein ACYDHX_07035 [Methanothrix sp.]